MKQIRVAGFALFEADMASLTVSFSNHFGNATKKIETN
jgi:hypothetical protein